MKMMPFDDGPSKAELSTVPRVLRHRVSTTPRDGVVLRQSTRQPRGEGRHQGLESLEVGEERWGERSRLKDLSRALANAGVGTKLRLSEARRQVENWCSFLRVGAVAC